MAVIEAKRQCNLSLIKSGHASWCDNNVVWYAWCLLSFDAISTGSLVISYVTKKVNKQVQAKIMNFKF